VGRPKYPLEAVEEIRRARKEEATSALASALSAEDRAKEARTRAEEARRAVEGEQAAVRAIELARLETGAARAADLVQRVTWEVAERGRLEAAARAEQGARERELIAVRARELARTDLAKATAAHAVVEKHRGRWAQKQLAHEERRDEEGAAETWQAQRG
jgi:dTMP kinase